MSTPFNSIQTIFLGKIEDHYWANLYTDEEMENRLDEFLTSAIANPLLSKKNVHEYDLESRTFTEDIDITIKEAIASLMIVEYLNPKILNDETLMQAMSTKDLNVFSPANQLRELRTLRDYYYNEARRNIVAHGYMRLKEDDF